jgi:hypothetical protein
MTTKHAAADQYRRDAILPDDVTMEREDVRAFFSDVNTKADAQDRQEAAQSAAMDALAEALVGMTMLALVVIACLFVGWHYRVQMEAELHTPAVEIDLDASPVPGGSWEEYDLRKLPPVSKP